MKVVVIGGGPAGVMAAITAAKNHHEVVLIEKNQKILKKLYITGKGRCNVTNNCDEEEFLLSVVNNSKFLYSSIYNFSPQNTMALLEENSCKTKTTRGNRVFPESDKSSDVIKTLNDICTRCGVSIMLDTQVIAVYKKDNIFYIKTSNQTICADKVVVATGGISYSGTGSTGDGYRFAKIFGHKIVEPMPALSAIKLKETFVSGLTLKNVELFATKNNKKISSFFGELLFTHNGISGPICLSLSSYINRQTDFELFIDFKPALEFDILDGRLKREFDDNKKSYLKNVLCNLLPKSFVPYFLKQVKIDGESVCGNITKEDRFKIVNSLKNFRLYFDSFMDIEYAIVTSGGISVKEINSSTMESKIVKDLYFAGELIDVDALTGGYNIQIALATGVLAGQSL